MKQNNVEELIAVSKIQSGECCGACPVALGSCRLKTSTDLEKSRLVVV